MLSDRSRLEVPVAECYDQRTVWFRAGRGRGSLGMCTHRKLNSEGRSSGERVLKRQIEEDVAFWPNLAAENGSSR